MCLCSVTSSPRPLSSTNCSRISPSPNGFETRDGGATWAAVQMGNAVNKVRIVPNGAGVAVFGIGVELHRLDLPG